MREGLLWGAVTAQAGAGANAHAQELSVAEHPCSAIPAGGAAARKGASRPSGAAARKAAERPCVHAGGFWRHSLGTCDPAECFAGVLAHDDTFWRDSCGTSDPAARFAG